MATRKTKVTKEPKINEASVETKSPEEYVVLEAPVEAKSGDGTRSGDVEQPKKGLNLRKGLNLGGNNNGLPDGRHFKGWWPDLATLSAAITATPGDAAYVKDASPATTWSIYEYDSTAESDGYWADSGTNVDTTYVQTFASGEEVNEVHIVNNFTGGTTNVASAETVKTLNEAKIEKEVTETTISYQDVAVESGYPKQTIITATGDEYSNSSSVCKIIKCAVSPAKKYLLKGKTSSNTRPIYYFYDAEDIAISGDYPQGTDYTTFDNITPPQNAAYIRLAGGIQLRQPVCQEIVTTTAVIQDNQAIIDSVGDVSELETTEKETVVGAINEVNGKFDAIAETVVSPNMFDKSAVIDGYINSSTGNVASSSSSYKMSDYIPVLPNHFYYLSGRSSSKVIRCLNADKSEVMKVLAASNGETVGTYNLPNIDATAIVANGQFKTPANAAFVQFNVIFAEGDNADSVMLTDVGGTYDSDYVVPAYQSYGTTTKVKSSAIDCDDTPIEDSEKPVTSGGVYEALQNVTPGATQPLKILLIGSSHGMNTIAQLPFIASKSGIPVIVGNVYQGSMSMQWMLGGALRSNYNFSFKLWSNGSWGVTQSLPMANILKLYDWDYISIQRSASDDEVWTTTAAEVEALSSGVKDSLNINHYQDGATAKYLDHNKTLQRVIDYIKATANNSPTILVNSNFTDSGFYATDKTNTYIIPSIEKMKDNFGIEYYSTAIALRNARGTFLQLLGNYINGTHPETSHNLTYDGQHIDYGIGCYLLSITLLGFILKMKGMGIETLSGYGAREEMNTNWWVPMSGNSIDRYTEPNEYTMACAKACAKAALLNPSQQNDTVKARFRWSVDYNLANGVASTNDIPFSAHQDKYETTLTDVTSQTVTVTSQSSRSANPIDITAQVYDSSTGKITINSVEGDIVITVE